MGSMGNGDQLERAFAGAVVHDMFNFFTVAILLPVEVITGYLRHLTGAMVKNVEMKEGERWGGPVDKYIEPLGARVLKENKNVAKAIASVSLQRRPLPFRWNAIFHLHSHTLSHLSSQGKGSCALGDGFYPIICYGEPSKKSCSQIGLIACDEDVGCVSEPLRLVHHPSISICFLTPCVVVDYHSPSSLMSTPLLVTTRSVES